MNGKKPEFRSQNSVEKTDDFSDFNDPFLILASGF